MDEFKSVKSVDFNMSFILMDVVSRRVIDMYEPYISLIQSVFPNAVINFDRFHIVQNLTRAMEVVFIK